MITNNICQHGYLLFHFAIIPLFLIFCSCCAGPKNIEKKSYDENKLVKMSPLTQIFLNDFDNEFKIYNKSDNFIPSEDLTKKYSLAKKNDIFFISGIIKIEEFSDDVDLKGLIINTKAGNILTVNIPLNQFLQVVVNDKIKYLQIDEKVMKK